MNLDPTTSSKRSYEMQLELFRTRLLARLSIAFTCMLQFFARCATMKGLLNENYHSGEIVLYALPLAPIVSLIVAIEYFLFKKRGPGILKYSQAMDLLLLLFFMGDWLTGLISSLVRTKNTEPISFTISAMYGFSCFAWRTLLVTLIVQEWRLKIIAPVTAIVVSTCYAFHYDIEHWFAYLIRAVAHVFNIIFIIYCEDKIKWRMIWTNLQQERWVQVNNFILNNIPENIMILDVKGETKFISDYCKSFMEKCNLSLNTKSFFSKVRELQQQQHCDFDIALVPPQASFMTQIESLTTGNGLIPDEKNRNLFKIEALTDLIINFKNIIKEKNLQERQFLIYNGKLKMDNNLPDKSIEVKVSFVQQIENEYIILILRDTTQRDLLIALEETNRYKDQLLASVSHELRAPLNGNINLVESAINSPIISEDIKENLLVPALRSSKFLLHMINDILDLSQIKEKKLRLVHQLEDIKETIRGTAQLVELQAQKKGIGFVLELDQNLPSEFCTDHMRLSQILLNLLSNAIKFTNEGTVKLSAVYMETSQWVKISVEDTGIGMSEENVKKLFTNYTHIEFAGRQTMNPTGVGLGLNIAFRLVKLLAPSGQKTIDVRSISNIGSSFSFILENQEQPEESSQYLEDINNSLKIADELPGVNKPLLFSKQKTTNSHSRTEKSETESLLNSPCPCPKVLVVDDNPFNIMAFETILASLNIQCESVYSGPAALKKLSQKCGKDCKGFSVIFMDQEMPEMNGIETVKEIRRLQKENGYDSKIIGCTAHKSKEKVEEFLEAGLDQCIHKPISACMIKDIL